MNSEFEVRGNKVVTKMGGHTIGTIERVGNKTVIRDSNTHTVSEYDPSTNRTYDRSINNFRDGNRGIELLLKNY